MKAITLLSFLTCILVLGSCKKDNSIPLITLLGKNPATTGVGIDYHDAGATAFDEEDGDITANIVVDNQVDNTKPGTCYVLYNVTDSDGGKALQVTRQVVVKYY